MEGYFAKAYAKVNLSLDVCGRREDGYHLLQSVMQEISLFDTLQAVPAKEIIIRCDRADLPLDENNIVFKVAKAYFAYIGLKNKGVCFTLEKHIPSGAGLGGGSADGVAALRLLDEMYGTHLTKEQMVDIVAPIGADLPFFVYGSTALAQGIGEMITPLSPLTKGAFLLVKPNIFMSTPKIFRILDEVGQAEHPDIQKMITAVQAQDIAAIGAAMGNSLQSAGVRDHDFILPLRQRLLAAGAKGAMLSGSGSTVFGVFETQAAAQTAAAQFCEDDLFSFVATPVLEKI